MRRGPLFADRPGLCGSHSHADLPGGRRFLAPGFRVSSGCSRFQAIRCEQRRCDRGRRRMMSFGDNVLPASQDPYGDPADQIQDAASQHLAATDPADTQAYVAQQVQGMPPGQANGLASTLLNAVEQQGVNVNGLLGQLGVSPGQAAGFLPQIMGMLHQNHPEELAGAVGQEPSLAGLVAHPSVGGVLGALASRFLGGG
jgi:hypothetical protein